MDSTEQSMKKSNSGKNRFEELPSIYKMTSIKQTMKKSEDDDVNDDIGYGGKNRFKELPSIYEMTSIKQSLKKSEDDDVNDDIGYGGKNRVKGLPSICKMSSNEQMMKKRYDDVDAGANLLDCLVPDIDVPIMKPSKRNRFNFKKWIDNAKTKLAENIKRKSSQIADWILNTRIVKTYLPPKINDLIKTVMGTKYSEKPIIHKFSDEKLSAKTITAFKNNAIIYKMKILDNVDPLNQMILLNKRKTYLLNKRVILLKGIKCNETLDVKFEKLGSGGRMMRNLSLSLQDLK